MKFFNADVVSTADRTNARSSASPARSESNRNNSRKSTGPKTEIGKKHMRFNALKHGCYAHELIVRPEYKDEIEKLQRDLVAQLHPKTALQRLAFKAICFCAWQCELGARLDMRRVNAVLFPPEQPDPLSDAADSAAMDSWYASTPEDLRKGVLFLDRLKSEVQQRGQVPDELKDSVRKGFGPGFLDLLEQPKSPISHDTVLMAHQITEHVKRWGTKLPPQLLEGPEVIIDPEQTVQATLRLIELMSQFLKDLRRIEHGGLQVSAADVPPRHFADASRALQRAVSWYQHLVANKL
jgi:hypothetical protein